MKRLAILPITLALALSSAVFGQEAGVGGDEGVAAKQAGEGSSGSNAGGANAPKVHYEQRKSGLVKISRYPNGSVSETPVSAAEAETVRVDTAFSAVRATHLCHAMASSSPRRLAAGQSGTLKVMVTLGGNAVVPGGGHAKLKLDKIAGLTFGAPVLRPAVNGKQPGKFLGLPVYDDYLLFEVPMTADGNLPRKRLSVTGIVELSLHDIKSGGEVGKFVADVRGGVPIGAPIPNPTVQAGNRGSEGAAGGASSAPKSSGKSAKAGPAGSQGGSTPENSPTGDRGDPNATPGSAQPSSTVGPGNPGPGGAMPGGPGGFGASIFVLAGVVGFVLIVLLLRRQ